MSRFACGARIGGAIALLAMSVGCGGDGEPQASTTEQWGRVDEPVKSAANQPPVIDSITFEPEEPIAGASLGARVDTSDPERRGVTLEYVWSVDGRRVVGDGPQLAVPKDLVRGSKIRLEVVATDEAGATTEADASVVLGNRAPRMEEIGLRIVEGDAGEPGEWVADVKASDPDGDDVDFRYEWRTGDGRVVGQTERLTQGGWRRGDELQLVAWPSDGSVEGQPLEGAPFKVGNSPPEIVSRPPGLDPSGRFVYQIEARDRDGDPGLRYALVKGPEGMSVDPFGGEVRWKAGVDDEGEHAVEIEVDDRKGGKAKQLFYLQVEVGEGPLPASQID